MLSASTMGGSFGTARGQMKISGRAPKYNYTLGGSWFRNTGISAADKSSGNTEADGYRNGTVSGRVGFSPHRQAAFDLTFRFIDASTDIDNTGAANGDDPNRKFESRQLFLRPQIKWSTWQQRWNNTLGYALSNHNREDDDPIDTQQTQAASSTFDSRIHKFYWQNTLHLHELNTVVFGVETEQEQGASVAQGPFPSKFIRQDIRMTGAYLQNQFQYRDMWFVAAGIRADNHSRFGSKITYRVTPGVFFRQTGTRLKGTYGTGFKAPSLFQLFSAFGDPTLKAGTSTGWDIGIEQYGWENRLTTGLTYFNHTFNNMVGFDNNTFTYNNIFRADYAGPGMARTRTTVTRHNHPS
jgi:vitamin B12 transporter